MSSKQPNPAPSVNPSPPVQKTGSASASSSSSSSSSSVPNLTHSPSEVAWMFVREYYHHLNREPSRLHLFYGKDSTVVHGLESFHVDPVSGQSEIKKLITTLNFNDARVVVSNVDSQRSTNDGVIIQVLGELSNNGKPSQKFVQTFFLAKQPTGYFILNDILRYLCEEMDEDDQVSSSTGPISSLALAPVSVSTDKKPKSREPSPAHTNKSVAAPTTTTTSESKANKPNSSHSSSPPPVNESKKSKSREVSPVHSTKPSTATTTTSTATSNKSLSGQTTVASNASPSQDKSISYNVKNKDHSRSRAKSPQVNTPAPNSTANTIQSQSQSSTKSVPLAAHAKPATWANMAASATTIPPPSPVTASTTTTNPTAPLTGRTTATTTSTTSATTNAPPGSEVKPNTGDNKDENYGHGDVIVNGAAGLDGSKLPSHLNEFEKSVWLKLSFPAHSSVPASVILRGVPSDIYEIKTIAFNKVGAIIYLATVEQARKLVGHVINYNDQDMLVQIRHQNYNNGSSRNGPHRPNSGGGPYHHHHNNNHYHHHHHNNNNNNQRPNPSSGNQGNNTTSNTNSGSNHENIARPQGSRGRGGAGRGGLSRT